ncbi:MAG: hypothetical protein ACI9NQ_000146 [Paracoccaceae bacterium]
MFLNQRVGRINTKDSKALAQRYLFHYFGNRISEWLMEVFSNRK